MPRRSPSPKREGDRDWRDSVPPLDESTDPALARQNFTKMARNRMKINEVRVRIDADAMSTQSKRRAQPGQRLQTKIQQMIQRREMKSKQKAPDIRARFPMKLGTIANENDNVLQLPNVLRPPPEPAPKVMAAVQHTTRKVKRRMEELKLDPITRAMVAEFLEANPQRVESHAKDIRKQRIQAARARREARGATGHTHIYEQELVLADATVKRGGFPKDIISASQHDVRRAGVGSSPTALDVHGDERLPTVFELEEVPSLATAAGTTLGARLPRLEGTEMVFDQVTVASLTMSRNTTMGVIQNRFDELYGPVVIWRRQDTVASERKRTATPPKKTVAKVACWNENHSRARSTTPTMSKGGRIPELSVDLPALQIRSETPSQILNDTNTTLPNESSLPQLTPTVSALKPSDLVGVASQSFNSPPSSRTQLPPKRPITFGPKVPLLRDEEFALLDVVQEMDEKEKEALELKAAAEAPLNSAPTGIIAQLIADVDSHDDNSSGSDYDPVCVICRSSRQPISQVTGDRPRSSLSPIKKGRTKAITQLAQDPSRSAFFGALSLDHWRAMHATANMKQARDMSQRFDRRMQSQAKASRSTESLKQMTERAEHVASEWSHSRGMLPVRRGVESVWVQPVADADEVALGRSHCRVFLRRVFAFCELVQQPTNEQQQQQLRHLRDLLLKLGEVSKSLFFRWLHLCGPSILTSLEGLRLMMFVQMELGFSSTAVRRWVRLPEQILSGWKLTEQN